MKKTQAKMSSFMKPESIDVAPTHEAIASKAKELWEKKGFPEGCDEETWLEAERLLSTRKLRFNAETGIEDLDDLYPGQDGPATTSL